MNEALGAVKVTWSGSAVGTSGFENCEAEWEAASQLGAIV